MSRYLHVAWLLAIVLLGLLVVPAWAQGDDPPCRWTGQKNTNWGDTENWEDCDKGIPTNDKDAIVGGGENNPALFSIGVARNITLRGQLNIGADGRLVATSLTTEVGGGGHIANGGIVETPINVLGSLTVGGFGSFTRDVFVAPLSTLLVSTGGGGGTVFNLDANLHNMGTVDTAGNNSVNFRGERITNDGTITAIVRFPDMGETQTLAGTGTWDAPGQIFLGNDANVALANDVTVTGMLRVPNNSHFDIGAHTLTFDGAPFFYVDLDSELAGSGTVRSQGELTFSHDGVFSPTLVLAAGTATGGGSGRFVGEIFIEPEATLNVASRSIVTALNNVTNDGTIADNDDATFTFKGETLVNDGTITANVIFQREGEQTLQGSGVFTDTSAAFINGPTSLRLGSDHQMNQATVRVGAGFDISSRTLSIQGPNQGNNGPLVVAPGGLITTTNSTVVFNGMVTQTIPSYVIAYHNLTANNPLRAEATQVAWPLIVRGTLRAQRGPFIINECDCHAVQIDEGASLAVNDGEQVMVSGNWTNNGAFTAGDDTAVVFDGTESQQIAGRSATTFRHLSIQNSDGVELDADATVTDRLTLDYDIRATGDQTLTLHINAPTTGDGDVWGRVRRPGPFTAGTVYTFGNPNVHLRFGSGGTLPNEVVVHLTRERPSTFPSGVQRTYRITTNGGQDLTASLRLHYRDSEVKGASEEELRFWKQELNGNDWQLQSRGAANTDENWLELGDVAPQGVWVLVEPWLTYMPLVQR